MLITVCVAILLFVGMILIDRAFDHSEENNDLSYLYFRGTCYWAGDTRTYMRIALDGYTNYHTSLLHPHLTHLNDHSWWPLFPAITSSVMTTLGGGMCSGRTVNGIAFLLLVPVVYAVTGDRRWWQLAALAIMPFGAWFFIGQADTLFMLLSGVLILAGQSSSRYPVRAALAAFIVGALVGLTKPNGLMLIPALGVWGLMLSWEHWRAYPTGPRWRRMLESANPGWAPLLGGLGIALTTSWWIYQTSGYYPNYVLLLQRSLWWREFDGGNITSFAHVYSSAVRNMWHQIINNFQLQRAVELVAVVYALALTFSRLPPYWTPRESIHIPLHWRVGVLGTVAFMFVSGQAHGFERYLASNIFVVLIWYRLMFGEPDQRVNWRFWTLPGVLRWTWLMLGPVLWGLSFLLLGWKTL